MLNPGSITVAKKIEMLWLARPGSCAYLLGLTSRPEPHKVQRGSSLKKGWYVAITRRWRRLVEQMKIIMPTAGTISNHIMVEAIEMQDDLCCWQSQRVRMWQEAQAREDTHLKMVGLVWREKTHIPVSLKKKRKKKYLWLVQPVESFYPKKTLTGTWRKVGLR